MTASVAETVPRRVSGKYDRAFYSSMAIGMALTVLIGFGSTYYMKPFSHTPMTTLSGGPPPIPAGPFTSPDDVAAQMPKAWGAAFTRAMVDHNLKRDAEGSWRWKCDLKVMAAYERSVNDRRKWPLWKAVKCPTLVLRGERSPAMSQQAAEQMVAKNYHVTLVVIPGAGHFIPLEASLAFEAAVRKWLSV